MQKRDVLAEIGRDGEYAVNFAQVQSMEDNCGEWVDSMGVASGYG